MGITKDTLDELSNKFSLSVPLDLYKEQYGECVYWCFKGVGLEKVEGG